jgi:hypothetical protein
MKQKKLREKTGLNMLSKYTGGTAKKNDIINLISTNPDVKSEKDKKEKDVNNVTTTGPVRKNLQFLKNLENNDLKPKLDKSKKYDENDPQFKLGEARKYENLGLVNKQIGISSKDIDDGEEDAEVVIQFEGYINKITESQKLKKLWFKLYDKDLFCKLR